jgi:hypothetical protein
MGDQSPTQPGPILFTAASCQIAATAWVVQLVLGDAQIEPGSNVAKEIPRYTMGLPWALAKLVSKALALAIEQYEATQGPIQIPKTVEQQFEMAVKAASTKSG